MFGALKLLLNEQLKTLTTLIIIKVAIFMKIVEFVQFYTSNAYKNN